MDRNDYDPDELAALHALWVRMGKPRIPVPVADLDDIVCDDDGLHLRRHEQQIEIENRQRAQVRRAEAGYLGGRT